MTASDDTVLPEPDSPTRATTSPASTPKLTWSTTVAGPASVRNSTDRSSTERRRSFAGGGAWSAGRVTVVRPRRPFMACLPLGSPRPNASRTPSPRVLKASTVNTRANAGTYTCHGCSLRYSRPSWIIPPQLEVGRWTPKPSRLSWASAMSAKPTASDTDTMSGDATLGRMRLRRIRPGFVPIECDASTNVSSRTARVCARVECAPTRGSSRSRWRGWRSGGRRRARRPPRARGRAAGSWRGRP